MGKSRVAEGQGEKVGMETEKKVPRMRVEKSGE